jgi:hypothetical protein
VNVSSSDTEAALEFLLLESSHVVSSRPSLGDVQELSLSLTMSSEWIDICLEANVMVTSVYAALTMEPSSSRQTQANVAR